MNPSHDCSIKKYTSILKKLEFRLICLVVIAVPLINGCASKKLRNSDTVLQVSTLNALIAGAYESDVAVDRLTGKGVVGLGTPNHLDGEMIILDGKAYRVDVSGDVHRINSSTKTPFAVVSRFEPDIETALKSQSKYSDVKERTDDLIQSKNYIQTLKIQGSFSDMKVRSVPRQSRPYEPLTEVVKNQNILKYESLDGVLVGFRFPGYMDRLNADGYHMHFLSEDQKKGGHVLDFSVETATLKIDTAHRFDLIYPNHELFSEADLSTHRDGAVEEVEQ